MTRFYSFQDGISVLNLRGNWFLHHSSAVADLAIEGSADFLIQAILKSENRFPGQELIQMLQSCGLSRNEAKTTWHALMDYGFLKECRATPKASRSDFFSSDLKEYLTLRSNVSYADYSKSTVSELDSSIMKQYIEIDRQPPLTKHWLFKKSLAVELLDGASIEKPVLAAKISNMLRLVFGVQARFRYLGLFDVFLKSVPSKGARHPFEAYIVDGLGEFATDPKVYYYHPERHALAPLKPQNLPLPAAVCLVVTIRFERIHWRYRHSWAYKDLFFDIGHLIFQIKTVAKYWGLSLYDVQLEEAVHDLFSATMVEELVLAFRIDSARNLGSGDLSAYFKPLETHGDNV